jgi:hypothetical protein
MSCDRGRTEFSRDGTMELVVAASSGCTSLRNGRRVLERTHMSGECQVRSLDHVNGVAST